MLEATGLTVQNVCNIINISFLEAGDSVWNNIYFRELIFDIGVKCGLPLHCAERMRVNGEIRFYLDHCEIPWSLHFPHRVQ